MKIRLCVWKKRILVLERARMGLCHLNFPSCYSEGLDLDEEESGASERPSTPAPATPIDVDLLYPPTPPLAIEDNGEFDIDDWVAVDEYDNPVEEVDNYSTLTNHDDDSVPHSISEELSP